jgi:hypothetical protein
MVFYASLDIERNAKETAVVEKTCAACDCTLDGEVITVTIGGNAVDVCCEDCATLLKEADASASGKGG